MPLYLQQKKLPGTSFGELTLKGQYISSECEAARIATPALFYVSLQHMAGTFQYLRKAYLLARGLLFFRSLRKSPPESLFCVVLFFPAALIVATIANAQ